ncbi:hypothetical protein GCM10025865_13870 [Paraoerskovia sediminicola]|uniref:non-specific serine/threonine protein kinase n=1 Tax=Paraoerskovia sediminicola TaxID=1138587 RepID=A0ABN6XAZ5_9CELL|nr:hypothetical protein GCM10025865_13870 [Paraoerskovia sediminicola]
MKPTQGVVLGGRYTLVRRIAIGGMGEVWVAADSALQREVAVKVLRSEYTGNEDFLARLRTEARNSAALSHPNIAQVHDYGEQDRSGYLVMELVSGEPMADLLEREPIIALPRLLPILAQTARALHAAHVAGVVHRDVKPGNILLDRAGDVKITDFGVSLAANQVPMTATGMVMGTAQYLSPEQAIGKPATGASDLYALGIVAYESVVGHRPFTGATPVDIAVAHVNEQVPALPSNVHSELARLIMQLLEKDPARRPSSGAALARRLDELTVEVSGDPWSVVARAQGGGGRSGSSLSGATGSRASAGVTPPPPPQSAGARDASATERATDPAPSGGSPRDASTDTKAPVTGVPVAPGPTTSGNPARTDPSSSDRSTGAGDASGAAGPMGAAGAAPGTAGGTAPRSYPPRRVVQQQSSAGARHPETSGAHDGHDGPARPPRTRAEARKAGDLDGRSRRSSIPAGAPAVRSRSGAVRPDDGPARRSQRSAPSDGATRATQRRTSTTTGHRIGGTSRGVSWPMIALAGLVLLVVIVSLVGCSPASTPDPDTLAGAERPIVTASLRTTHAGGGDGGMMLPAGGTVLTRRRHRRTCKWWRTHLVYSPDAMRSVSSSVAEAWPRSTSAATPGSVARWPSRSSVRTWRATPRSSPGSGARRSPPQR